MTDKHELFSRWMEHNLTETEQQQFEQLIEQDREFAQRVELAGQLQQQATDYHLGPVPKWQPPIMQRQPSGMTRWWGWSPLSFATSMLAIVMVLFQVELRWHEQGVTLSFAGQGTEQEIATQVAARLASFEEQQQVQLAQYRQDLQQQQQQSNMQLANYLLSSSRTERREDFAELIKFVNEQRSDDQLYFARQLNEFQQQVYENTLPANIDPDRLMMNQE
ncbi:hypothetical protein [Lacimicrobium sp. SS2-24]|uniref:hypothetical protein n=1 Tax=Lacimicrobium sp. SS2-24 TaxID=2005569 RepID=UPI000B4B1E6A|nr:hypothetical protein [Lacimicrobium sp. SS2-24]